jgi:hypothetical protein
LLVVAITYGIWLLVSGGRMSWPPSQLLASIYTVAGCLALVGPVIVLRNGAAERGLGELLWMTGGMLVWVFNIAAAIRGSWRSQGWAAATPLSYEAMGMTILAVLLAGWFCRVGNRTWSWTNVTGWVLGVFWVGMAVSTFVPAPVRVVGLR